MDYSKLFTEAERFRGIEASMLKDAMHSFRKAMLKATGETRYYKRSFNADVLIRDLRFISNKKGN